MALTDPDHGDKKAESHRQGPEKKEKLFTKVIVRRLPPTMDQETFLNQISPVPLYDYLYMVKGDASLGENSFARAYINFTNPNDIFDFREKFDNYVFLDNSGHEYPAVVEFATFQKIPKRRNKVRVDPKVGTIETDPSFLEFVEMMNKPPETDEKPEYTYQLPTDNKNDQTTPLLEYVKHRRAEKMKIREERREERKRKEFEKKKFRDDKKRYEDKSVSKSPKSQTKVLSPKDKHTESETDKNEGETSESRVKPEEKPVSDKVDEKPSTSYYKNREKKYEDKRKEPKPKYTPKKEYPEKKEYKKREDYKDRDYRPKFEEFKKDDVKVFQKKVKKYSEKREERKMEAQKAEQKKIEQQSKDIEPTPKSETIATPTKPVPENRKEKDEVKTESAPRESPGRMGKSREDSHSQKRIRNKDRPTIAIYRPGMLSKRKQNDGEGDGKDNNKE